MSAPRRRKDPDPIRQRVDEKADDAAGMLKMLPPPNPAAVPAPPVPESHDTKSWGRMILDRYRAVEALHSPYVRWFVLGFEDRSYDTGAEAQEWIDGLDGGGTLQTFTVCKECGRIETQSSTAHELDEPLPYELSEWPCPTARAMGAT